MKKLIVPTIIAAILLSSFTGCQCNHKWSDASCTSPYTCAKCGETSGSPSPHNFANATCTSPEICRDCGATGEDMWGHDWKDATCDLPKTCNHCGATEGDRLEHSWIEATSEAPKTCQLCGEKIGDPLPKYQYLETVGYDTTDKYPQWLNVAAYNFTEGYIAVNGNEISDPTTYTLHGLLFKNDCIYDCHYHYSNGEITIETYNRPLIITTHNQNTITFGSSNSRAIVDRVIDIEKGYLILKTDGTAEEWYTLPELIDWKNPVYDSETNRTNFYFKNARKN